MQRRAVAVYVAFFLLVGSATGVLVTTAQTPGISFENPDHDLSSGDTFEVNGEEYTFTGASENDDGEIVGQAERNRTTERSESWSNGSTVQLDGGEWTVRISGEDPDSFTLVEVLDRTAILENDSNADNETIERDGEEYVVVTENGESRLVTPDEYFPAPEERSYAVDDEIQYDDRTVTVDSVSSDAAVVVWMETETVSTEIVQNSRVTIGETEFVAHFSDTSTLTLSTDFESFEAQNAAIDRHETNSDGLWRVMIISLLSSGLFLAMAFMPSRY
ncbi:hypothetical protein SAMN04488066_1288 [Halorubrum aquaticum]|uniref:Uncharacterized protein n=1 Tax=Halorubrum aquaticum TaxID=387340 RepID=A0A1I3CRU5_9EURY|nr:hypothetical protein [Halorubrum aquaticum]SFH77177.1 hypothetical protein SAMN04488066_1288 [Halorubrum aquaticum]